MEKSNNESLVNILHGKTSNEAAEFVLKLMQDEDPKILNLCDEDIPGDSLNDVTCQNIAERALKDLLDTIKSEPITTRHLFSGSVLVAIKDLNIVKKYLWKDKTLINVLETFLRFAKANKKFLLLRDIVAHLIQATLLGGTPASFFELICDSEIIELYTDILKNKEDFASIYSYEEILLSLLLLCQNNKHCIEKCYALSVAEVMTEFSTWSKIDSIKDKAEVASGCIHHMVSKESLPDHKRFMLDRFSEHIHSQNRTCKGTETVVCSYPPCGKLQAVESTGRFKKCGRCRVALYCCKDCQVGHWKNGHSKVCVSPT